MRAVLVHVTDSELANRRAKGLDRWDEMWEGVLHMTPAPSLAHQRILKELIKFLDPLLTGTRRGELVPGINLFEKSDNYRIPDLTFVAHGREHIFSVDGVRGGGPDAVIEIRSPEDETYDKLLFYGALAIREVVVIERDTKRPEIFRLAGSQYVALQPDADGWLRSETMTVKFRVSEGQPPRLRVEDERDPAIYTEI
jgi:Uma2 family endonuclease